MSRLSNLYDEEIHSSIDRLVDHNYCQVARAVLSMEGFEMKRKKLQMSSADTSLLQRMERSAFVEMTVRIDVDSI